MATDMANPESVKIETQEQNSQPQVQEQNAEPRVEDESKAKNEVKDTVLSWPKIAALTCGLIFCMYIFLVGLSLMGGAFKVLGGKGASKLFTVVDNPVSGLMTGVLATVLVQSSSTSTSIVVAMVGADIISVYNAIPIIMGANIGTSVTNTIVSMGHVGDRIALERAFSGATVHDSFNLLSVLTLLPLEVIVGAMTGGGGPLYWLTHSITEGLMGGDAASAMPTSPTKAITKPVVSAILKMNKYVIYALTLGAPEAMTAGSVNSTVCQPLARRLAIEHPMIDHPMIDHPVMDHADDTTARHLLSRRLSEDLHDCSTYYCIGSSMDKNFKKISKTGHKNLVSCKGHVLDADGKACGKNKCYLDAGSFYDEKVTGGKLITGGFVKGAGDIGGGIIGLIISLILLCVGLAGLCKMLAMIFMSKAKSVIRYATKLNDYVALLIGIGITILVQSSSFTTSALTPLCGVGVLPLEKMFPMTLGANIGTTCTALIASLVSMKFGAVQIAFCHFFFNVFGILVWFPVPFMRRIPLGMAKLLGLYASYYRFFPAIYLLLAFVVAPGIFLLIAAAFGAGVGVGIVVSLVIAIVIGVFEFFWLVGFNMETRSIGNPLCYRVLSKEMREQGHRDLEAANAELRGEACKTVE